MYNFLRLKSLRIPVMPEAEVSAWFGEKLTNQRSTTGQMSAASKKGNRHIDVSAHCKHGRCTHLHRMTFPPEVRTHWFCFDGTP
jgi:hypothetical protein